MIENDEQYQEARAHLDALLEKAEELRKRLSPEAFKEEMQTHLQELDLHWSSLRQYLSKHPDWNTPEALDQTNAVSIIGPLRVVIRYGDTYAVRYEVDEVLREQIRVFLQEGTLALAWDIPDAPEPRFLDEKLEPDELMEAVERFRHELQVFIQAAHSIYPDSVVYITLSQLTEVRAGGGAFVTIQSFPHFDELALRGGRGGGGIITFDQVGSIDTLRAGAGGGGGLRVQGLSSTSTLVVGVGGGGRLAISGDAQKAEIRAGGGGRADLRECHIQEATASVAGEGQAYVWVEQALEANIGGGGALFYKGTPTLSGTYNEKNVSALSDQ